MNESFQERKERENQKRYKKWLSCGFTGEMHINDCGWCDNGLSLSNHEQARRIHRNRAKFELVLRLSHG